MAKPAQCATRPPQHFLVWSGLVGQVWLVGGCIGWSVKWRGAISNPTKNRGTCVSLRKLRSIPLIDRHQKCWSKRDHCIYDRPCWMGFGAYVSEFHPLVGSSWVDVMQQQWSLFHAPGWMLSVYEDGLVPNGLNLTEGRSGSVLSKEKKTATHLASDSGIVLVNLAKKLYLKLRSGWWLFFCKSFVCFQGF